MSNKVFKTALDYRATQSLVDTQVAAINTLLTGRTLLFWQVGDEFLIVVYTNDTPASGEQLQIGCLISPTGGQIETAISALDLYDIKQIEHSVIWLYKV